MEVRRKVTFVRVDHKMYISLFCFELIKFLLVVTCWLASVTDKGEVQ